MAYQHADAQPFAPHGF
jgi:hypothetical protein